MSKFYIQTDYRSMGSNKTDGWNVEVNYLKKYFRSLGYNGFISDNMYYKKKRSKNSLVFHTHIKQNVKGSIIVNENNS